VRAIIEFLAWLLPPCRAKNVVLRRFGHSISDTANIGPTLVAGVGRFEIGDGVVILPFNVIKGLSLVRLDDFAVIASWNWIAAAQQFQRLDPKAGTLHVQFAAKIGSRNILDSSGTIILRPYSVVGGNLTYLQSHEPDFEHERQTAGRIVIGHHSLVNSCALVLKGASLPDQSILDANATLLPATQERPSGIYTGSPAIWKGDVKGKWFERSALVMKADIVEGPMGPRVADSYAAEKS
jgi:acetyltransferase-like isoleucine patch superfamily enzyme